MKELKIGQVKVHDEKIFSIYSLLTKIGGKLSKFSEFSKIFVHLKIIDSITDTIKYIIMFTHYDYKCTYISK